MLTIENYGRRWERAKIAWGSDNNKGHLKRRLKRKKSVTIDFRDQIGINVLFNAGGEVVYVGQAGIGNKRLFARLKDHRGIILGIDGRIFLGSGKDALHEIEAVLMSVVEPALNKQRPSWIGSQELLQYRDPSIPPTTDEIVHDLPKELVALSKKIERLAAKVKK